MNLLSPVVLGAAGVCASPALYQALTGGMPMEVALSRYLVALGLCWVAISVVAALVGEPPAPARVSGDRSAERTGGHPEMDDRTLEMERPPGVPAEQ